MRPGYRKVSSDSEGLREYAEWTDPETGGGRSGEGRGVGEGEGQRREGVVERGRGGAGEGEGRRGGVVEEVAQEAASQELYVRP